MATTGNFMVDAHDSDERFEEFQESLDAWFESECDRADEIMDETGGSRHADH